MSVLKTSRALSGVRAIGH